MYTTLHYVNVILVYCHRYVITHVTTVAQYSRVRAYLSAIYFMHGVYFGSNKYKSTYNMA